MLPTTNLLTHYVTLTKRLIYLNLYLPRLYVHLLKLVFIVNSRSKICRPWHYNYAIAKHLLWYKYTHLFLTANSLVNFRKLTQWMFLHKNNDLNILVPNLTTFSRLQNNSLKLKILSNIKRARTHLTYLFFIKKSHSYLTRVIKRQHTCSNSNNFLTLKPQWFILLWHLGINALEPQNQRIPILQNKNLIQLPMNYNLYIKLLHYWHLKIDRSSHLNTRRQVWHRRYYKHYNYKIRTHTPPTIYRIYHKYDISRRYEFDLMAASIFQLPGDSSSLTIWYFLLLHTFWSNTYCYNWQIEY